MVCRPSLPTAVGRRRRRSTPFANRFTFAPPPSSRSGWSRPLCTSGTQQRPNPSSARSGWCASRRPPHAPRPKGARTRRTRGNAASRCRGRCSTWRARARRARRRGGAAGRRRAGRGRGRRRRFLRPRCRSSIRPTTWRWRRRQRRRPSRSPRSSSSRRKASSLGARRASSAMAAAVASVLLGEAIDGWIAMSEAGGEEGPAFPLSQLRDAIARC